jgi:hypothetical protein
VAKLAPVLSCVGSVTLNLLCGVVAMSFSYEIYCSPMPRF